MEIEQLEIVDYLAQCAPLNKLDKQDLNQLAIALEISYSQKGQQLLKPGENNYTLFLIRSGALAVYDKNDQLTGQHAAGEWVGYKSALGDGLVTLGVKAIEDTLIYRIPANLFSQLMQKYSFISEYFSQQKPLRIRSATQDIRQAGDTVLVTTPVQDLVHGQPLLVKVTDSIREVARSMTKAGYTVALVMDQDVLVGIVTDRAYCTKVVAKELSVERPVSQIMTPNPLTIDARRPGSQALLMMAQYNIRHIPVLLQGQVQGVVTATDLIRQQSHNSIYLINEIHRAGDLAELVQLAKQIPNTLLSLVENSLAAYDIGNLISSIGEAIVQRMIKFAQDELGQAPVSFAWIIAGSMARNEQTAVSDQDNGLILSDDYIEAEHASYFEKLSHIVCDGLNACGYVYCPGNVMATNPKWRQPQKVWKSYFDKWINQPEPKALMYASIFFDLRCAYGDDALLQAVREDMLAKTQSNERFLINLAANALQFKPPLGLFRNFVMEDNGHEEKALDLKKRGVVPITDLARVFALSAGLYQINTQDRMEAASEAGVLSKEGMSDLRDALEFIATVRLQHQSLQSKRAQEVDNYVSPEMLSPLERRHLKDAFDVVRMMQDVLKQRY
ncbi:MAG: DUF294 nucleotidyltransferase-like domain-containing protein [Gammaproteobacteria bacterium]|nr:DUF294 nucleotidyltransferase-like domain-containing protein [Gammaproteobacteria bacterium]